MPSLQKHISKNLPLYLFLVLVGTFGFLGQDFARLLQYDRSGILSGDYYRLLSGHFVHLGRFHTLMNMAAVILLWAWFREIFSPVGWFFAVLSCALMTSLMLLTVSDVDWYVGLSGILHGLLLLGTARKRGFKPLIKWIILAALFLKIGLEQIYGASPKTVAIIKGEVIEDAHLFGAAAGALMWCALLKKKPGPSRKTDPV
jgi:rhomboid family GlyGly-CTERM serine protease